MENNKGKLIVIEGLDGAGKSTQVKMLKDQLKLNNYNNFHFTRECSDGPIGKLLRYTYLTGDRKCDERVINMLYAADRFDHITNHQDGMLRYLDYGFNVVTDRYYLSSMAYNSYMMSTKDQVKDMIEHTIMMNKYTMETLRPDLTIYIDLDPDIALARMNNSRDSSSVYETKEKLTKIYDAYNMSIDILRSRFDENIVIIDGNKTMDDIHYNIYNLVLNLINE